MTYPYGETVTRLRGIPVSDPYSEEVTGLDWTNPIEQAFDGCAVWDTGSVEPVVAGGDPVLSDFTAALPAGADVTPQDRIRIRGLVCEVVGRPFDWTNPFTGWNPGVIVNAKIKEG
jgi:uncharacterized protein (DUF1501 family)